MWNTRLAILVLIWFGPGGAFVALAQTTANISGSVTDATGGVLPRAEVVVTNADTNVTRTTTTDDRGRYHVANLSIGRYDVSANMTGFQTAVRRGIVLTIGREAVV